MWTDPVVDGRVACRQDAAGRRHAKLSIPKLIEVEDPSAAAVDRESWDAVVVVSPTLNLTDLSAVHEPLRAAAEVDARVGQDTVLIPSPKLAGGRLIFAPTGELGRDWNDVRRCADAPI